MATNQYFTQYKTSTEQDLLEDLIIESIQQYGYDLLYIPRVPITKDEIWTEYGQSAFVGAIPIEMYVKNVFGFEGEGDFVSSFGLEMRDQVVLSVAKSRFDTDVVSNTLIANTFSVANVAIDSNTLLTTAESITLLRPREGDLMFLPFANTMMEIRYVENEQMFYPLGKLQTYDLRCEKFEYSQEFFHTGNDFIDTNMNALSLAVTSGNTLSGANNDPIGINWDIQQESDEILDFTDVDPFAENNY